jgi:hypothetical protein
MTALPTAPCRWIVAALAVLVVVLDRSAADERFTLQADYPAAVAKAGNEGRLLLVLDLSEDFTARGLAGEEVKAYQSLAFDARVRDLLDDRFVATFRQVGMPASLNLVSQRGKLKQAEPHKQHAIAYVCLPDERVIHFVPGFVAADQLYRELLWAEQCYFDLIRFPAGEQPVAARQMHLDAADPADVELLRSRTQTGWLLHKRVREYSRDNLATSVRAVRQLRLTRLDERFAGAQNAMPARVFYDALADHGSLETTSAHAVLAEFPLPPLADLASPLYEIWFRDHFWQLSPRRGELKDWFVQRVGKGKPVLLAVTGTHLPPGEAEPRKLISWPPTGDANLPLTEFDVLELTLDELTVLITDAGHAPLSAQRQELPQFVVYDRIGRRKAVLSPRDGISKLRLAMRAPAQPGVAAASDKGKKRDK